MRRNYFLGGIVSSVAGAVGGSLIKGLLGGDDGGGGRTGGGGSTKLAAASFLEQASQRSDENLKALQKISEQKQENPVKHLIDKLLSAYEDEGGKREDLNKYWNA